MLKLLQQNLQRCVMGLAHDVAFDFEQVAQYQAGYRAKLQRTLGCIYPVCAAVLGEEIFHQISHHYISLYPSTGFSIANYGAQFWRYLAQENYREYVPCLVDCARMEWAWYQVFNQGEVQPTDLAALQNKMLQCGENIIWQLASSVRLLQCAYGVDVLWRQHQDNLKLEKKYLPENNCLLLWREREHVFMQRISNMEFTFLQLINLSLPFWQLCQHFSVFYPESRPEQLLVPWMQRGLIT